jgi:hypothetical protein
VCAPSAGHTAPVSIFLIPSLHTTFSFVKRQPYSVRSGVILIGRDALPFSS